ncbi:hypothetical protein ACQY0O_003814 [Thecaphora frezii]
MKVAIIGAGPSALVTAKTLLEESDKHPGFNPQITIFEAEDDIGGTFRYRAYSNATLVSSKQLTCFSDFRLPLEHHDHLTLPEYVRYLEHYTQHFELRRRCRFRMRTRVTAVDRLDKGHRVRFVSTATDQPSAPSEEVFSHLCVCSGLHVVPAIPEIPGLPPVVKGDQPIEAAKPSDVPDGYDQADSVGWAKRGTAATTRNAADILTLHSSQFKDRSLYRGKRVMILGTGETGMDMAYEAVKAGAEEIVLCTRAGFLMFPAVLADFVVLGSVYDGNLPIDGLITNLFETAYVHPWVAASHLRWFVSDFVIKRVLWFLTGTQAGCNQWVGELEPERLGRAYTFLNKSSKAMPYINRGWKNRPWIFEKFASYLDPPTVLPEEPSVDLAPFPSHVTADGKVVFRRNGRKEDLRMRSRTVRSDVVVYATGYKQDFAFLSDDYPVPATVRCRDVFDPSDPSVAFIGFVRPGVGAIPPIAEMQAQLWTLVLRNKVAPPTSTPHYYLLVKESARIKYGVDYSSYVSQLARDMGTAPGLRQLLWEYGLKVTLIYCFCAAFPTLYRLVGPYRHPDAKRIVETEIYDTIKRRGLMGNLMMGLIPMMFYAVINLAAYALEKSLRVVATVSRPFLIRPLPGKRAALGRGARQFQSDYGPTVTERAAPPDRAGTGTGARAAPRGKLLRLFALIVGTLAVAVDGAQANTEIRNIGAVLCRADEYGHLAAKAADQLSAQWPVLRPTTTPNLFTVRPEAATSYAQLDSDTASRLGAWLVLDLSNAGEFRLPLSDALVDPELEAPRDRLVRRAWNAAHWRLFRRYSVRVSYAANVPTRFHLEVYTPEAALQKGNITWEAEKVGEKIEVQEEERASGYTRTAAAAVAALPTATEVAAGEGDRLDDGIVLPQEDQDEQENEREQGKDETLIVMARKFFGNSGVKAKDKLAFSPTAPPPAPVEDWADLMYPCPKVYLHLVAFEDGVAIHPERGRRYPTSPVDRAVDIIYHLGEATIGRLVSSNTVAEAEGEGEGEEARLIPIHLTLEPLTLGVVPATAWHLIALLVPASLVGYLWIRQALVEVVRTAVSTPSAGKLAKAE